jgi:ATP-dependent Clp protease ATP-binding subunit ClpA
MTKKVEKMVERANNLANDNNHEYVTLEHILLSMLGEKDVNALLLNIGAQPAKIKNDLIKHLADPGLRKLPQLSAVPAKQTKVVERTFQRALTQRAFSGHEELDMATILISILSEDTSHAHFFLVKNDVTRDKITAYMNKQDQKQKEENENPLKQYCRN